MENIVCTQIIQLFFHRVDQRLHQALYACFNVWYVYMWYLLSFMTTLLLLHIFVFVGFASSLDIGLSNWGLEFVTISL